MKEGKKTSKEFQRYLKKPLLNRIWLKESLTVSILKDPNKIEKVFREINIFKKTNIQKPVCQNNGQPVRIK